MVNSPATTARSSDAVFEQLHLAAWRMVQAGRRPTADLLVSEMGGSKVTAVAALRSFWSDYLPQQVAAQPGYAPDPVVQAANALWRVATREAQSRVDEEMVAQREALSRRETELAERERTSLEDQVKIGRRVAELTGALATAKTAADKERASAEEHKHAADKAQRKAESTQGLLDKERQVSTGLREQRDALRAQLRDALQQLRDAVRAESEAQFRARQAEQSRQQDQEKAQAATDTLKADLASIAADMQRQHDEHEEALAQQRAEHASSVADLKDAHQAVVDRLMLELDELRTTRDRAARDAATEKRNLEKRLERAETRLDGMLGAGSGRKPKAQGGPAKP